MVLPFLVRGGLLSKPFTLANLAKSSTIIRTAAQYSQRTSPLLKSQTPLVQECVKKFHVSSPRNSLFLQPPAHWVSEKTLSALLYFALPAAIMFPGNLLLDNVAVVASLIHAHWGLDSITIDYVRPKLFGPVIPQVARFLVAVLTVFSLGSLLYFNYNDVGFGKAVRAFWAHDYSAKE